MNKRLKIQIFPDGRVKAEVKGIKGKKCTEYIQILEEILNSEVIDSEYTSEYYESESKVDNLDQSKQHLKD